MLWRKMLRRTLEAEETVGVGLANDNGRVGEDRFQ